MRGLKYMLLTKILLSEAADVASIVSGKLALKYSGAGRRHGVQRMRMRLPVDLTARRCGPGPGRHLEAMQAVASAFLKRSIADFEKALSDYALVARVARGGGCLCVRAGKQNCRWCRS